MNAPEPLELNRLYRLAAPDGQFIKSTYPDLSFTDKPGEARQFHGEYLRRDPGKRAPKDAGWPDTGTVWDWWLHYTPEPV